MPPRKTLPAFTGIWANAGSAPASSVAAPALACPAPISPPSTSMVRMNSSIVDRDDGDRDREYRQRRTTFAKPLNDDEHEEEQVRASESGVRSDSPSRTQAPYANLASRPLVRSPKRFSARSPQRTATRSPSRQSIGVTSVEEELDARTTNTQNTPEIPNPDAISKYANVLNRVAIMQRIAGYVPDSEVKNFVGINAVANEAVMYHDGLRLAVRPDTLNRFAKSDKLHDYLYGLKYEGDINPFTEDLLVYALQNDAFKNATLIYLRIPTVSVRIGERTVTFKDEEGTHTTTEDVVVSLRQVRPETLTLAAEKKQVAMLIHMLENFGAPPPQNTLHKAMFGGDAKLFGVFMEWMVSKGYIQTTKRPTPLEMRQSAMLRQRLMTEFLSVANPQM